MSDEASCCQRLVAAAPSPFDVVVIGFYDGPTSGVAKCRACGRAYAFTLLGWDDERDVRIFGLSAIRAEGFESVRRINDAPVSATEARSRADELTLAVRDATAGSFGVDVVVAAADLAREIVAARTMSFSDWAKLLRLP